MLLETSRLKIRKAQVSLKDINFIYGLWTNGNVTKYIGFPNGIPTSIEKIAEQIKKERTHFNSILVVENKQNGELIGECKLTSPRPDNICQTDIKLLPEMHGQGFGKEIKKALLDYLFQNTKCNAVEALPTIDNEAAIKLQKSVGAEFVDETSKMIQGLKCQIYRVYRKDWK